MAIEKKIEVFNGDGFLDSHGGGGDFLGGVQLIKFDTVASVGNAAVVGTVQERFFVNRPFRIKKVYGACSAKAGSTDPTFDVYADATPATVLAAVVTLDAADAIKAGTVASPGKVHAAGIVSLRAATAADGTITNLKGFVELELIPA